MIYVTPTVFKEQLSRAYRLSLSNAFISTTGALFMAYVSVSFSMTLAACTMALVMFIIGTTNARNLEKIRIDGVERSRVHMTEFLSGVRNLTIIREAITFLIIILIPVFSYAGLKKEDHLYYMLVPLLTALIYAAASIHVMHTAIPPNTDPE